MKSNYLLNLPSYIFIVTFLTALTILPSRADLTQVEAKAALGAFFQQNPTDTVSQYLTSAPVYSQGSRGVITITTGYTWHSQMVVPTDNMVTLTNPSPGDANNSVGSTIYGAEVDTQIAYTPPVISGSYYEIMSAVHSLNRKLDYYAYDAGNGVAKIVEVISTQGITETEQENTAGANEGEARFFLYYNANSTYTAAAPIVLTPSLPIPGYTHPSGTISPSNSTRLLPSQAGTLNWNVTNGG